MIEVLQFVFRDFWTWLGAVILVASLGSALVPRVVVVRTEK